MTIIARFLMTLYEFAALTQRISFMQQRYIAVVIMLKIMSSALSLNFCLFAILKLRPTQLMTGRADQPEQQRGG